MRGGRLNHFVRWLLIWRPRANPLTSVPEQGPRSGLAVRRKADVVRPSPPPDGLAIGAMIKNAGRYLREWIEFHLLQGVRRFYLYDDGSTDDSLQVLAPYVADGRVRVIPWRSFIWPINSQKLAHAHAIGNVDP